MSHSLSRRFFLAGTATASMSIAGRTAVCNSPLVAALPPVDAQEGRMDAKHVQFRSDTEPLVRLIETTPRDQLVEVIGQRVKDGLNYQQLLAALFLAGIRNIQPRPAVGFKFHAVLVVNSAHLASMASPPEDRWLPIFWSLDEFKKSQARDEAEGDWTMAAVDESSIPDATQSEKAFEKAMQSWDEQAADVAAARQTVHWLAAGNDPHQLLDAARRLIFLKGNDVHDYKFSSAVLEDFILVSPAWRNRFLAASTASLRGSQEPDNGLVDRIRTSFA